MDCAKHAVDTLLGHVKSNLQDLVSSLGETPKLAHGEFTATLGPDKGKRGFHAWVEIGPLVLDCGSKRLEHNLFSKEVYYRIGQICVEEVSLYTVEETLVQILRHEHYGPWTEETESKR